MDSPTTKACSRCGLVKSLEDFGLAPNMKLGRQSRCRRCQGEVAVARYWRDPEKARAQKRAYYHRHPDRSDAMRHRWFIRKTYGVSVEEYEQMVLQAGGRCAICGDLPERRLSIDHDHTTGAVRGVLCGPCNSGLGFFQDDPKRLENARQYLIRWILDASEK